MLRCAVLWYLAVVVAIEEFGDRVSLMVADGVSGVRQGSVRNKRQQE